MRLLANLQGMYNSHGPKIAIRKLGWACFDISMLGLGLVLGLGQG